MVVVFSHILLFSLRFAAACMKILGIETSCDETAAAVVEDGTVVHSNVIASQIPLHQKTGGVVPEVAAREHVLKIVPVIDEALRQAKMTLQDIDAIAVTQGPGLLSSLVIGVTAASTLAVASAKKLIPVNHIAGHIYANWLDEKSDDPVQFPVMVLTVSGGHNELVLMKSHYDFDLLGETLDDAAGEAFDKVARILGLGYPGGPQVSRAAEAGNAKRFNLPRALVGDKNFDFSFSGLKTAVLNLVKKEHESEGALSPEFISDTAASFEEAVCDVLTDKLLRAAAKFKVREVHLAGGVSANRRLRAMSRQKIDEKKHSAGGPVLRYALNLSYCTDNAAMIASAAYFQLKTNGDVAGGAAVILADPGLSMYH
jgi:N6-L-threonylcarbamoyladenine synthase